jgi:hypothetical protein
MSRPQTGHSWWKEDPRNVSGRAHALTAISALRPHGRFFVRAWFAVGRRFPALARKLRALSFIHAARWTIVEDLPGHGRLRAPLLLFESNFNGDWGQYIDAFAYVIPRRMAGVWWTSWGWPGARPAGPFKAYIRRNELVAEHYYAAYPEHTVTEILAALQLKEAFEAFQARTRGMTPAEFDAAWTEFLTEVQRWL